MPRRVVQAAFRSKPQGGTDGCHVLVVIVTEYDILVSTGAVLQYLVQ